jgi:3-phenylpropionate/trans-cinnamate dioxygenase ferredoxin reductase subunit
VKSIVVVGTSLAGLRAAQELRAQGFDGHLVLVGDEPHRPYDRPPLSKDFLLGKASAADLELADAAELLELNARWYLGKRAVSLSQGEITLDDGTELACDGVVIATGGTPKTLAGQEGLTGVHTLRTLDDALALRRELDGGRARVVVIGAGFVGAEVASTCHALGCPVTVVEAAELPLAGLLGERMARVCAGLHAGHGVPLLTGTGVAGLAGDGRVTGVELADGRVLPADVVVVGVGIRPNTGWLAGSGLPADDGVLCDQGCVTADRSVVAVGDVARFTDAAGRSVRGEHWTGAATQPAVAVRNLLAGTTVEHYTRPGYFWSEQYGHRLQFAGSTTGRDGIRLLEGVPEEGKFVVAYLRESAVTGVLAMDSPRGFTRIRRELERPAMVHPG